MLKFYFELELNTRVWLNDLLSLLVKSLICLNYWLFICRWSPWSSKNCPCRKATGIRSRFCPTEKLPAMRLFLLFFRQFSYPLFYCTFCFFDWNPLPNAFENLNISSKFSFYLGSDTFKGHLQVRWMSKQVCSNTSVEFRKMYMLLW